DQHPSRPHCVRQESLGRRPLVSVPRLLPIHADDPKRYVWQRQAKSISWVPPCPPLMIIYPLVFFTAAVALDIVYLITSNSFVATLFFGLIAAGVLVD